MKQRKVADPFKVLPMTDHERKLNLRNALAAEANRLTNDAKDLEYKAAKVRQRIEHLRGLLAIKPKKGRKPTNINYGKRSKK